MEFLWLLMLFFAILGSKKKDEEIENEGHSYRWDDSCHRCPDGSRHEWRFSLSLAERQTANGERGTGERCKKCGYVRL